MTKDRAVEMRVWTLFASANSSENEFETRRRMRTNRDMASDPTAKKKEDPRKIRGDGEDSVVVFSYIQGLDRMKIAYLYEMTNRSK